MWVQIHVLSKLFLAVHTSSNEQQPEKLREQQPVKIKLLYTFQPKSFFIYSYFYHLRFTSSKQTHIKFNPCISEHHRVVPFHSWMNLWVLLTYLCILISFPRVLAPSHLGYEGRMQGEEMRTEESKDEHWNILDHANITSKRHQLR